MSGGGSVGTWDWEGMKGSGKGWVGIDGREWLGMGECGRGWR